MKLVGYLKPFKLGSFSCPIFKKGESYFVHQIDKRNNIKSFAKIDLIRGDLIEVSGHEAQISEQAIFVFIDMDETVIIGTKNEISSKLRSSLVYNNSLYPNISKEIDHLLSQKSINPVGQTMLSQKMKSYDVPQRIEDMGLYPYYREIRSEVGSVVNINGKDVLMFGSNNYLGLTNHPRLKEAAIDAIKKYGTGSGGSRFLSGNLDIHTQLEE